MAKTLLSIAKELIDKIKNEHDHLQIIQKEEAGGENERIEAPSISIDILE